jgi:hypothetical protein
LTYQDDELKPENIRYTLGIMEHTMINLIKTHKDHQHGLKTHDPVVVIHKDDFEKILNTVQDDAVKDKFYEVYQSVKDW